MKVIKNSAGNSFIFEDRAPRMMNSEVDVASAVNIFVKELSIVTETAKDLNFPIVLKPNIGGSGANITKFDNYVELENYLNTNILAVDLSLKSLAYAKRKVHELGLKNIHFLHTDDTISGKFGICRT